MIGVIGANGVAATNQLCDIIEEKVVKAGGFRDCHHPEMIVWYASQVPSRSMYLEGRGESFIPQYVDIANKLQALGCNEICMCCNTAHYFINQLQEEANVRIVNLLEEVAKAVAKTGSTKVGLMCTDGLKKVNFYDEVFAKICPAAHIIYPSDEYQELVTRGICNAKNIERYTTLGNPQNPTYCFDQVVKYFVEQGVECIVAGCTDINKVFSRPESLPAGIAYVDSLEVLADYIVAKNKFLPQ